MQAADVSAQLFDSEYDDIPGFQGSPTFLHSLVSVSDLSTVSSQVLQALSPSFCPLPVTCVGWETHAQFSQCLSLSQLLLALDLLMFPLPTNTGSKSAISTWIAFSLSCVCE